MRRYKLYITKHCATCARVVHWLETHKMEVPVVDVSDATQPSPPVPLFIFPALFSGNKLIAYGDSIPNALSGAQ